MYSLKEKLNNDSKVKLIDGLGIVLILAIAVFLGEVLGIAANDLRTGHVIVKLDDYKTYKVPTRVYDIKGKLITEFFKDKRKIIPFSRIPNKLVHALVSMEDSRFYQHKGMDSYGIMRAFVKNIAAWRIVEGGSTITQQLAKLLFTKSQQTYTRKMVDLWLALQIEKRYTKNEILEKYFNQIYFGHGIYGVETASQYFFGKHVQDITIAEAAMLVAITPAPRRYSPFKKREAARSKQRLVLKRMVENRYASQKEVDESFKRYWEENRERIISVDPRTALEDRVDQAPYFTEYVRQHVEKTFKKNLYASLVEEIKSQKPDIPKEELEKEVNASIRDILFTGGFRIYTTLDLDKQQMANKYLREQLAKQDQTFKAKFSREYKYVKKNYTDLLNFVGFSLMDSTKSGHHFRYKQNYNAVVKGLEGELDTLKLIADVHGLDRMDRLVRKYKAGLGDRDLARKVEGALVSIDPRTGHIVAMVGGRKYSSRNQLNRVFSKRQPGSAFKAFVYGAALNTGLVTPATYLKNYLRGVKNASGRYGGELSVRKALKYSVNTIAVRLVMKIGAEQVIKFSAPMLGVEVIPQEIDGDRFKEQILDKLDQMTNGYLGKARRKRVQGYRKILLTYYKPDKTTGNYLLYKKGLTHRKKFQVFDTLALVGYKLRFRNDTSISLGTVEMTPMEMCTGMAVYANGGRKVDPIGVLRITDRYGNTIINYEKELRIQRQKALQRDRRVLQVISPQMASLMTILLKGVVEGGTGSRVRMGWSKAGLGKIPAAGKTGTTQTNKDVWFVGYTPYLSTAVWIGFDEGNMSLGTHQYGGNVAAPVWGNFMREAQKAIFKEIAKNRRSYRQFPHSNYGLVNVRVCKETGLRQGKACKLVHRSESFLVLAGTLPEKICPGHGVESPREEDAITSLLKEISKEKTIKTIFGIKDKPEDKKDAKDDKKVKANDKDKPSDSDKGKKTELDRTMSHKINRAYLAIPAPFRPSLIKDKKDHNKKIEAQNKEKSTSRPPDQKKKSDIKNNVKAESRKVNQGNKKKGKIE